MSRDWVLFSIKLIFAFGGIVALVAFVIVPLWRMLRTGPDPDVLNPYAKLPDLDEEEEELDIPVGGDQRMPGRAELLELARKDPRLTATLVSNWLKEKKKEKRK